jgi:hypothetical protein
MLYSFFHLYSNCNFQLEVGLYCQELRGKFIISQASLSYSGLFKTEMGYIIMEYLIRS